MKVSGAFTHHPTIGAIKTRNPTIGRGRVIQYLFRNLFEKTNNKAPTKKSQTGVAKAAL
jgi:hypothetical protein